MRKTLYDYCIEYSRKDLLDQWDEERNGDITPHSITYGSRQKVWWKCEKGHRWQTFVYTRTGNGSGCPYCAGIKISSNDNSLAAVHPDLISQWHPTKNGNLKPDSIPPGTNRKVWWICEKGHEWQAAVKARTSGRGCPVCSNHKLIPGINDLVTTHPLLAQQWHPTKNGSLTPNSINSSNKKHVWWICDKGHEWQASILARSSNGTGCPVCAGKAVAPGVNDLATTFPRIAAQWHPTLNRELKPEHVTSYSNKYVWWQCEKGHEWRTMVINRTKDATDCPYCTGRKVMAGFNDLATINPQIAAQWHPTLNGSLTPEMVTTGSSKKVWWQCSDGHVWKAVIFSRTRSNRAGCPVCAGKINPDQQKRYASILSDPISDQKREQKTDKHNE